MNGFKIVASTLIGAAFSGIGFAVTSYFYTIHDHSSTLLGPASDWWLISSLAGLVFGAIVGAFSGLLIAAFKLRIFAAIAFGGLINLTIAVVFIFVTGGNISPSIKNFVYALVPIGIINGAIIALSTLRTAKFE